jgi:hypothetical protein
VELRNYLAHYFWYERIHLTASLGGIEEMVNELASPTCFPGGRGNRQAHGTVACPNGSHSGAPLLALAETMSGKDLEPLNRQRKPKEETIVAAFDIPVASGRTVLVFQTKDGALWQFCDGGLGWTPYDTVDPAWPLARKFGDLLPAKINPGPPVSAPWTFDIQFGPKATLSVRPGTAIGEVLYRLRWHS